MDPECDMDGINIDCLFQVILIFCNHRDNIFTTNLLFEAQFSSLWCGHKLLLHQLMRIKVNNTFANALEKFRTADERQHDPITTLGVRRTGMPGFVN